MRNKITGAKKYNKDLKLEVPEYLIDISEIIKSKESN